MNYPANQLTQKTNQYDRKHNLPGGAQNENH